MSFLRAFGLFWYRFLIGDDWIGALIIACGLAATFITLNELRVNAYWLLPLVLLVSVTLSLYRRVRWLAKPSL